MPSVTSPRSKTRSMACMLSRVCSISDGSLPSHRRACMGPCSSLLMIPRLSSSRALRSFLVMSSPPQLAHRLVQFQRADRLGLHPQLLDGGHRLEAIRTLELDKAMSK